MKKLLLIMALSLGFLFAAGFQSGKGYQNQTQVSTTEITTIQKAELLYIYQEEKVARDVYITLGKVFPKLRIFQNIQKSEQTHMDAVAALCIKYDIDISDIDEEAVGVFVLPELQDMYNTLVERGSQSKLDALYVGELIELVDIDDLEAASIGMPRDVQRTFFRLKQGSLRHLSSFRAVIAQHL